MELANVLEVQRSKKVWSTAQKDMLPALMSDFEGYIQSSYGEHGRLLEDRNSK